MDLILQFSFSTCYFVFLKSVYSSKLAVLKCQKPLGMWRHVTSKVGITVVNSNLRTASYILYMEAGACFETSRRNISEGSDFGPESSFSTQSER
jgi:hypothetical protein